MANTSAPRHAAAHGSNKPTAKKAAAAKKNTMRYVCIAGLVLLFAAVLVFFIILLRLNVLPGKWLVAAGALSAILVIILAAIAGSKKRGAQITGFILCCVFAVLFIVGSVYLGKTLSAIHNIQSDGKKSETVSQFSAVVLASDPAQSIQDTASYTYGVYSVIDPDAVTAALHDISEIAGTSVANVEYSSLASVASALYNGEVKAILLNESYRDMILDVYATFSEDTRILESVETRVEVSQDSADEISIPKYVGTVTENNEMDSFIVYLTGIDTYGSVNVESRSDVNILAVVNPKTKQIALITTPRDSYVPLPARYNNMDKLTHAALYGGPESSMATLAQLYDASIDYYIRLNFTGFSSIVDSIGGIDVYSEYSFSQPGYSYSAGVNHLNGDAALAFVRCRYAFSDGDFQRGRNQMAAITAILDKVTSPAILTSYMSLLDSISDCFTTNIPDDLISNLVKMQLEDNASWHITSYELEGYANSEYCYSIGGEASTVDLYSESIEKAKDMIRAVYSGETLS